MYDKKIFEFQDIARSNYHWNESKLRINLILSAALLFAFALAFFHL